VRGIAKGSNLTFSQQQVVLFEREFIPALYRYLKLTRPPRETRKDTTEPDLIRFRALRELAGTPSLAHSPHVRVPA